MTDNTKNIIGVAAWTAGTSVATVAVEHLVVKPLAKLVKAKLDKKNEEVKVESDDSTEEK